MNESNQTVSSKSCIILQSDFAITIVLFNFVFNHDNNSLISSKLSMDFLKLITVQLILSSIKAISVSFVDFISKLDSLLFE